MTEPPLLADTLIKAVRFTASRPLTEAESEMLIANTEEVSLETLDPRLQPLSALSVFDVRCVEYLQDCFSSNQLLSTSSSGPGKPTQWLLVTESGKVCLAKLDKSSDSLRIYRLKGEDDELPRALIDRVLHWLWLRLTSNC